MECHVKGIRTSAPSLNVSRLSYLLLCGYVAATSSALTSCGKQVKKSDGDSSSANKEVAGQDAGAAKPSDPGAGLPPPVAQVPSSPSGTNPDPTAGGGIPNAGSNGGPASGTGSGSTRYYMVVFGAQKEDGDAAKRTHVWATLLKVTSDKYPFDASAKYEQITLSWLPADYVYDDTLCLKGLFKHCDDKPGKNFDLPTTLKLLGGANRDMGRYGPFEVKEELFKRATERVKYLDSGFATFRAQVDDDDQKRALMMQPKGESNAQHALSDLNGWYDFDGDWGFDASERALQHLRGLISGKADPVEDIIVKKLEIGSIPVKFFPI